MEIENTLEENKEETRKEAELSLIKILFQKLTDEERLDIMNDYCKYCGKYGKCFCWNDK